MKIDTWQIRCSTLRFGLSGEILPDLAAWEKAIQVYDRNWFWVYEWMWAGFPSPPEWFYKTKEEYLSALQK